MFLWGMARTGRPKTPLVVTDEQRTELERLARRARTNRSVALRAKIVLASAKGLANTAVAAKLRTTAVTVGKWRKRFIEGGVGALYDEPRPGAPRKITDEDVEAVVVQTLESKPQGADALEHAENGREGGD